MAANGVMEREVADDCCSTCIGCCREFLAACWEFCLCRDDGSLYSDNEELSQDFEMEDSGKMVEILEEITEVDENLDENDNGSGYTEEPRNSPPLQESSMPSTQTVEVILEHLPIPEPPPLQVIPATPEHETSES